VTTDPMTLVGALFGALNRREPQAAAFYAAGAVIEGPWVDGALDFEHKRFHVVRIAGIETGWGWVRADWALVEDRREGEPQAGYSYFWIEDGAIGRQRNVLTVTPVAAMAATSNRHYPSRPIVGVGGVIVSDEGRVVLVERRHEPLAGQWSLPGGSLELGETLAAGTAREMLEETGLVVDVGPMIEVFDRILLDEDGKIRYHFVLIDYLCRPRGGQLRAGGDAASVALAAPDELSKYRVTEKVRDVVQKALLL